MRETWRSFCRFHIFFCVYRVVIQYTVFYTHVKTRICTVFTCVYCNTITLQHTQTHKYVRICLHIELHMNKCAHAHLISQELFALCTLNDEKEKTTDNAIILQY